MSARESFAKRLSLLMRENGTKQKELADFLNLKPHAVSQYTTGRRMPDYDTLCMIAGYYGVPLNWLLGTAAYQALSINWISVTDRLPAIKTVTKEGFWGETVQCDISLPVLGCTDDGHMAVVRLTTGPDAEYVWVDELGSEYDIDYWMPLPQPPEEIKP